MCESFVDCRHLSSNDVIAKIVLRDIDLLFKGKKFESRPCNSCERPFRCDEYE